MNLCDKTERFLFEMSWHINENNLYGRPIIFFTKVIAVWLEKIQKGKHNHRFLYQIITILVMYPYLSFYLLVF